MDVQTHWWESYFGGVSVRMWLQAVPAEHMQREADWLARLLAVSPGAEILDVPCEGEDRERGGEQARRITGFPSTSPALMSPIRSAP